MNYLPDIYREFQQQFPQISKAYDDLAVKCHEWGPLDKKVMRLFKLGVSIGLNSEGAVRSHARRALEEGITAEELYHAMLLAFSTAGFPTTIAAMKWINEVVEKHKK